MKTERKVMLEEPDQKITVDYLGRPDRPGVSISLDFDGKELWICATDEETELVILDTVLDLRKIRKEHADSFREMISGGSR
jgi:hypothetical protein